MRALLTCIIYAKVLAYPLAKEDPNLHSRSSNMHCFSICQTRVLFKKQTSRNYYFFKKISMFSCIHRCNICIYVYIHVKAQPLVYKILKIQNLLFKLIFCKKTFFNVNEIKAIQNISTVLHHKHSKVLLTHTQDDNTHLSH